MEPEDNGNKPITHAMIQEGLETYQKYQTAQTSDLLTLVQPRNDDENSFKARLFTLQKLHAKSKTGEDMPLLLVNVLKNNNVGNIEIFEWDPALGNENFEIINQDTHDGVLNYDTLMHPRRCANVDYSFMSTIGNDVQCYKKGRGYFQETLPTPLWYCYVSHIVTEPNYQKKGIAKLALSELIKFAFHSTSIDFINAYIKEDNYWSRHTFEINYFDQLTDFTRLKEPGYDEACTFTKQKMRFMSLDGKKTAICPKFVPDNTNSIDSNWYLSREKWRSSPSVNSNF
jgi:GNAT superfamily N-acetyltransferase